MKSLKDILKNVTVNNVVGSVNVNVKHVVFDSRKVVGNSMFVAINGVQTNGHQYIQKAIQLGATVIVCEDKPTEFVHSVTYIQVKDSKKALAEMASNFYNNPSSKLQLVGITGTNGKTTIATLLYNLFKEAGCQVGLLSTVKIMVHNQQYKATHTTPDSLSINYYLNEMVKESVKYCFMEVSSHGIDQKRTDGLTFRGGVFTNLTHDHLDYHHSFKAYRDVKKLFFDQLPKNAFALTNIDDKNGSFMVQNTAAKTYSYALKTVADFKTKIIENQLSGMLLQLNNKEIWTRLVGAFNAYNITAIYGVAKLLQLDEDKILTTISNLNSVAGRFQTTISKNGKVAIIDYAHTPDALKNVLLTIHQLAKSNQKIITVVGCGGNRDKAKRPIMGQLAAQLSSQAIFTSDNPRDEDPETIIKEMELGVDKDLLGKVIQITNRAQAIKMATKLAENNDVILIAGKGHETYQEIKGVRNHFDDLEEINKNFNLIEK